MASPFLHRRNLQYFHSDEKKVGTQPDSDVSVISGLGVINWVLGLHFKAVWQLALSRYLTAH